MKTRTGLELPRIGQGTWRMGEDSTRRLAEVTALRLGIELGMRLIDTAEMYGDGVAEEVVAEAVHDCRDEVILVSKVLPQNASYEGTIQAAERSLARLKTDRIDLYLLHWMGSHPLQETYAAFRTLIDQGKIRHFGVSNFDFRAIKQSEEMPDGRGVASNQVLYNPERRGIEFSLLPWCGTRGINVMAYSPFEQGNLAASRILDRLAKRHDCTPYQVVLAWCMRDPAVTVIPKAVHPDHVRENAGAAAVELSAEDLVEFDRAFPPPNRDEPLGVR